jgi:hypothetical protein
VGVTVGSPSVKLTSTVGVATETIPINNSCPATSVQFSSSREFNWRKLIHSDAVQRRYAKTIITRLNNINDAPIRAWSGRGMPCALGQRPQAATTRTATDLLRL